MAKSKSRGRRAEKKSKKEESSLVHDSEVPVQESGENSTPSGVPNTFFGLVDSNELDYFKQAESKLNINAFDSDEDRQCLLILF